MNLTITLMALFNTRLFYHEHIFGYLLDYAPGIQNYLLFPIANLRVTILKS
jgi:hypothetical protein